MWKQFQGIIEYLNKIHRMDQVRVRLRVKLRVRLRMR